MEENRSQVVVSVLGEKTAVHVINENNEASIIVGLDPAPIKVFVGSTHGSYATLADIERMLQEQMILPGTYYNSERLGGFMWHEYPRKNEDAIITGDWRHTGTLALGGNFTAQAPLHNSGASILSGVIQFGENILSNDNPVGGFGGNGFIYNFEDGHLSLDNLTVRKAMRVYELIINQIRGTNGSLWVSDTVKVKSVEETPIGWKCFVDTADGDAIVPFVIGDVIRAQKWTGQGVRYYSSFIIGVTAEYFVLDKTRWDGSDTPLADDVIVRIGNENSESGRQGALYLTSSDDNSPYMDVIDGVDNSSLAGKTKVRLGRLDGLYYYGIQQDGYGLYAERALLTGAIRNLNGQWALNEDGSGTLAGGVISWTKEGVFSFGNRGLSDYATVEGVDTAITQYDASIVAPLALEVGALTEEVAFEIHNLNGTLFTQINNLANRKNTRYISATEPVLPIGIEFRIGDEWVKEIEVIEEGETTYEYESYMWFGTEWRPNLTTIDGARITTGVVDAARIIATELFAQEIGAVKLHVAEGFVGGFTINNMLVAESEDGKGISIDPTKREILIKDLQEGLGISQISIRAGNLTPEALLNASGGAGFKSSVTSNEINIRNTDGNEITSNNIRAVGGVTIRQYIHSGGANIANIKSTVPSVGERFTIETSKNYVADLPYNFRIYHNLGKRNGRHHKLHGNLKITVTSRLIGRTATGTTKELVVPAPIITDISRSTREITMFERPVTRKVSFNSLDCTSAYWEIDVKLEGNLTYQQWTSALDGKYWMTTTGWGIDYRAVVPHGCTISPSMGIMEMTTSGFQFMWGSGRFFKIDGRDAAHFVTSQGKWVHNGDFQLNGSDIVTINNVSSAIASDLSAYATKTYVDNGFYNTAQSDDRYAKKGGDVSQDFVVNNLTVHGLVNHWVADVMTVDDAFLQLNRRQTVNGQIGTVDSGLIIFDKTAGTEVSRLQYTAGTSRWQIGGQNIATENWVTGEGYAKKAANEVVTGAWTFNNNLRLGAGTTRNLYTSSMRVRDTGTGAWFMPKFLTR